MSLHHPIPVLDAAPQAYTGPYPIRSHRTLAEIEGANARADFEAMQDGFDAEHARCRVHYYRVAPRGFEPVSTRPVVTPRIFVGMINGAIITGVGIVTIALVVRTFGALLYRAAGG